MTFTFVQIFAMSLRACRGKSTAFATVESLSASSSLGQLKLSEGVLSALTRMEAARRAGRFSCRSEMGHGCGEGGEDDTFSLPRKAQRRKRSASTARLVRSARFPSQREPRPPLLPGGPGPHRGSSTSSASSARWPDPFCLPEPFSLRNVQACGPPVPDTPPCVNRLFSSFPLLAIRFLSIPNPNCDTQFQRPDRVLIEVPAPKSVLPRSPYTI
jgi:hypothetical protein